MYVCIVSTTLEAIPNTAAWTLDHWPPLRDCLKGGLHAPKICYQVLHVLWIILAEWVRCRNNHFNQGFLPRTEGGLTSIRAINVYSPHIITLWRGFSEQSLPPSCSVPFQIFANLPPPPTPPEWLRREIFPVFCARQVRYIPRGRCCFSSPKNSVQESVPAFFMEPDTSPSKKGE